jgi:putative membrane protein
MDLVRVELGMCLEASGSRDAVGVELQAQNSRRRSFARIDLDFIEIDRADAQRQKHHGAHGGEALITFGFSIYKFFQLEAQGSVPRDRVIGPRAFAFMLVSIGLLSLLLATLEYRQNVLALGAQYAGKQRSLAVLVAALISILGIVALLAMIFRH